MSKRQGGHRTSARIMEAALLIIPPILFHYLVPITTIVPRPYAYLGIVPMLLGLGVTTWASRLFREEGTGFQLQNGGSSLVTTGPYRFSRNPMYLGMLLWLLGLAVLLGSLTPFLFPVLFFLLANFLFIPLEERRMQQAAGEEFTAYKRRVRRWL